MRDKYITGLRPCLNHVTWAIWCDQYRGKFSR